RTGRHRRGAEEALGGAAPPFAHGRREHRTHRVVGRWPTRSNKSSSDPPDQNVSSNEFAACCSRRTRKLLSKMIAHDQKEARSRISITSLTMLSDCRNSSKTERCWVTVPGSEVASKGCIDGGLL